MRKMQIFGSSLYYLRKTTKREKKRA